MCVVSRPYYVMLLTSLAEQRTTLIRTLGTFRLFHGQKTIWIKPDYSIWYMAGDTSKEYRKNWARLIQKTHPLKKLNLEKSMEMSFFVLPS
jgi:hypothetical protein